MSDASAREPGKLSWRFPSTFWYANGAELCERAAYYGMFITLFRYLNKDVGFTDVQSGIITALFSSLIYFFPTFMGIMADKIGFKQALMLAFSLLTAGYALLGALQLKVTALVALALIMLGGAIIKPVISGTVAKCSDSINRARAMSIFYMVVNIGSFTGKGLAAELNNRYGFEYIIFYAAGMSFVALLLVAVFYKNPDVEGVGKTVGEAIRGLGKVMLNVRFDMLIIIIGGFWAIQGQLYGAMPSYVERLLGAHYEPEWLANINPLVVVIFVVPITQLVRTVKPANAIGIGLLIIPFTALVVAINPLVRGAIGDFVAIPGVEMSHGVFWPVVAVVLVGLVAALIWDARHGGGARMVIPILVVAAVVAGLVLKGRVHETDAVMLGGFSLHTMVVMFIIGIGLQGLAECFLSPKWLEFASKQAPKGEVGLYLGYSHLTTCVSWFFAFILAGVLLETYCPDPRTLKPEVRAQWRSAIDPHFVSNLDTASVHGLPFGEEGPQVVPIPDQLRAAVAARGMKVAPSTTVQRVELERSPWSKDAQAAWSLQADGRQFTIVQVEFEIESEAKDQSAWDWIKDFFVTTAKTKVSEVLLLDSKPRADEAAVEFPEQYQRAHYIWYGFTAIGVVAFVALVVFNFVTGAIDKRRVAAGPGPNSAP